jgi:hypothetical protein
MPSNALNALLAGVPEVDNLMAAQRHLKPSQRSAVGRAIRRASTVALSSHYERYLYVLNEEAVEALNREGVAGDVLPQILRLYHSKPAVELLSDTAWEQETRVNALRNFVSDEAWLWQAGARGRLDHARLLEFMSAPKPSDVMRYFRYWEIGDIFNAVTQAPHVRARLYVKLLELVDRRNGIAHGDPSIDPSYHDVMSYKGVVKVFCSRVDRTIAKRVAGITGSGLPW